MNGLLSIKEAAELAKVHRETISRLIRRGEIKTVKIGSLYRIRREDFEEYLNREAK